MSGTDINGNWWYARNFWNFSLWNSKSPFQLQFLWLDPYNYSAITQHWYSKQLPFGYNLYYLEKRRRRAQAYVSACGRKETQIIHDAVNTINFLEYRLDNKKYFYGDKYVILKHNPFSSASYIYNISVLFERLCVVNIILFLPFFRPSSIDALIFGYLAPILKLPLPSDRLQQHIMSCPNVVRFIESIISIYLPLNETQIRQQAAVKVIIWLIKASLYIYGCYETMIFRTNGTVDDVVRKKKQDRWI